MVQYRWFLVVSVLFLGCWEWSIQSERIPAFILPAPSAILGAIWEHREVLFKEHLPATLSEALVGFLLSLLSGASLAIAMHFSPTLQQVLYPFLVISQTIPLIAISPIFVLWFGYSLWSKVAVTILIAFFPIVINTFDGFKQTDPEYRDLLKSMGASRMQIFLKVDIPMALPSFFTGLKMAAVFCVIGATIGEWLGASEGLGYFSRRMSNNFRADGVFSAVVLLALLGMALFMLITLIEKQMVKWGTPPKERKS